jgi:hypothetical protein
MEDARREQAAYELANELLFKLEKQDGLFRLVRESDVHSPVHRDGLTLTELEQELETWKLRGFHGG